jgi:hypothetical protein
MPLDSQFRAILDALERAGALPLVRGDAVQTRAHYRKLVLSRRGEDFVPEQVAAVADRRSPAGVPVRIFEHLAVVQTEAPTSSHCLAYANQTVPELSLRSSPSLMSYALDIRQSTAQAESI